MRAKTVFEGYGYEEEELGREEFSRQIEELHQYGPDYDEEENFYDDEYFDREENFDEEDEINAEQYEKEQNRDFDRFDLDQDIYDRNPDYDMDESLNEESDFDLDYSEAQWKMDKFMPDEPQLQSEYYEILDNENMSKEEKIDALTEFFENYADDDEMYRYFPTGGSVRDFAKYIVDGEAI